MWCILVYYQSNFLHFCVISLLPVKYKLNKCNGIQGGIILLNDTMVLITAIYVNLQVSPLLEREDTSSGCTSSGCEYCRVMWFVCMCARACVVVCGCLCVRVCMLLVADTYT